MQLDTGMDLIRNFSQDEFSRALESWDWIGIGDKSPVFTSPFGDVFFRAVDDLPPGTRISGFTVDGKTP
jgi:hypothetical protein